MRENKIHATDRLVKLGVLVAISLVLVYLIRFPIFPAVPFMEYEPGDVPILIGGFVFGPVWGLFITLIVCILQGITVSAHSDISGIIMHFIATGTLVAVSSCIYGRYKTKKGGAVALIAGSLAMVLIMIPANLLITPLYTGVPIEAVLKLLPFIVGFNLIKAGANAVITFFLYKRISDILHRTAINARR